MSKQSNTDKVQDAMSKIANGKTSSSDRDEAFRTIGRIDRQERGKR